MCIGMLIYFQTVLNRYIFKICFREVVSSQFSFLQHLAHTLIVYCNCSINVLNQLFCLFLQTLKSSRPSFSFLLVFVPTILSTIFGTKKYSLYFLSNVYLSVLTSCLSVRVMIIIHFFLTTRTNSGCKDLFPVS